MKEDNLSEELLSGQVQLLEMLASGKTLSEVLTALVLFIESRVPKMICTILLLEDGVRLRHGAAPNLPAGLIEAIDGSSIGPKAGSCGTAAYLGKSVYVEDIAKDPLWEDYRNVFLFRGLRACWSQPIFDEERHVLGTFAIYFRQPARPEALHLRLFDVASHVAAVAISNSRAQEGLRRSEKQLRMIYDCIDDGVFLLMVDADQRFRFVSVNRAFLASTGLRSEQVVGKTIDAFVPPAAQGIVFPNYWKAIREKLPVEFEETWTYPTGRKKAVVRISPVSEPGAAQTYLLGVTRNWQDA